MSIRPPGVLQKNDPALKTYTLQCGVARGYRLDPDAMFFNVPTTINDENDCTCLCLLNIGPTGFLAITQATFDEVVADLVPDSAIVRATWLPLGKSFSFVWFASSSAALAAYHRFHAQPTRFLPTNGQNLRLGHAAFVRREMLPNPPPSFAPDRPMTPPIPGLHTVRDLLTEPEANDLLRAIDEQVPATAWIPVHGRHVVHYGAAFQYTSFQVESAAAPPIPPWLAGYFPRVMAAIHSAMQVPAGTVAPPFQVTVSRYARGTGIPPHVDVPDLGRVLASLSLGSGSTMDFVPVPSDATGGADPEKGVERHEYMPPRSLMVLSGEARDAWTHGIRGRTADEVDGRLIERVGDRVSLVFRCWMVADSGLGNLD
ncbi:hypothetical protein BC828DRAFT_413330, partial [Blastocladiella britannica]